MFKKIVIIVAALLVVFAIVVALQPAEFTVTRSATINAPTAAVFAQVNDLHKWEAWSPWLKRDPAAVKTYEGAPAGAGAVFAWSGNRQIGAGQMTVTDSRPNELVRIDLDFDKPLRGRSVAEFTFVPQGDRTAVTWTMTGKKNFIGKAIHLVINMDKMIGNDFSSGLAGIKSIAESVAAAK